MDKQTKNSVIFARNISGYVAQKNGIFSCFMRSVNGRFWLTDIIYLRRVVGESMLPALKQGNIVFGVSKRTYKVGDIVIAKVASKEVIKRVYSLKNDSYDIRGDNKNFSTDSRNYGLVSHANIIGKVVLKI